MNYWWTSDYHLGHANIIKYCMRTQFINSAERKILENGTVAQMKKLRISQKSLDRMNNTIIRNHNERVKPEDVVFMVGDFCFHNSKNCIKKGEGDIFKAIDYEKRLNGKLVFIKGNHDKNNSTKTIIENLAIKYGGKRINLVHNPAFVNVNYELNFVGHVHNNWEIKRFRRGYSFTDAINVGVDVWGFKPVSYNEIMKRYSQFKRRYNK